MFFQVHVMKHNAPSREMEAKVMAKVKKNYAWSTRQTSVLIILLTVVMSFLQDEANKYGGKWIVRLRKGLASRCWENLVG